MAGPVVDAIVIEMSYVYRVRAKRLRTRAQMADIACAQELLLKAEEYEYRAERFDRRRAALRNVAARVAANGPLVPAPSLCD
jgi:hypothetical protein